jgi:hypothetical protein
MKQVIKDFIETIFYLLLFFLVWFAVGYAFATGFSFAYTPTVRIETRVDTIERVIYRDTADSQFMKTIIELECGAYSNIKNGKEVGKIVGDGGRAIGIFGMHHCYFDTPLTQALQYEYEEMFDADKAYHVFWAVSGIHAYNFKRKFGRVPTLQELARMHNGSINQVHKDSTLPYLKKFNKVYNRRIDGNPNNKLQ